MFSSYFFKKCGVGPWGGVGGYKGSTSSATPCSISVVCTVRSVLSGANIFANEWMHLSTCFVITMLRKVYFFYIMFWSMLFKLSVISLKICFHCLLHFRFAFKFSEI